MTDPKFLGLLRASIAVKQIPKKVLARRCKLSRPYFSLILHGDKPMPDKVKRRLIKELEIESQVERLGL